MSTNSQFPNFFYIRTVIGPISGLVRPKKHSRGDQTGSKKKSSKKRRLPLENDFFGVKMGLVNLPLLMLNDLLTAPNALCAIEGLLVLFGVESGCLTRALPFVLGE